MSAHRAYLATRAHKPWPVTGLRGGYAGKLLAMCGTASADDAKRQLRRAAAAHQRGDLVPVDAVGGGLG